MRNDFKHIVNQVSTSSSWEASERRHSNRAARAALRSGKGWDLSRENPRYRSFWDTGRNRYYNPIRRWMKSCVGRHIDDVMSEVYKVVPPGETRQLIVGTIMNNLDGYSRNVMLDENNIIVPVPERQRYRWVKPWQPGRRIIDTAIGVFEVELVKRDSFYRIFDDEAWPEEFGPMPKEFRGLSISSKRQLSKREIKRWRSESASNKD